MDVVELLNCFAMRLLVDAGCCGNANSAKAPSTRQQELWQKQGARTCALPVAMDRAFLFGKQQSWIRWIGEVGRVPNLHRQLHQIPQKGETAIKVIAMLGEVCRNTTSALRVDQVLMQDRIRVLPLTHRIAHQSMPMVLSSQRTPFDVTSALLAKM